MANKNGDKTPPCQFQATGQPVSQTQASDAMTSGLPRYEAKCVQRRCVEPWLMACWKARVEFLLSVIKLLFLSLTVGFVPGKKFFGFYKTRHILLSDSANCTVLRAVVLTQYRRVTDRRTDRQTDRRNCRKLLQRLQCEHCGAL